MRSDAKALWSVFWRCMLFIPIMLPVGLLLLFLPVATVAVPPFLALFYFLEDDLVTGLAILVGWLAWMFLGRRVRKKLYRLMSDGWEYAGI